MTTLTEIMTPMKTILHILTLSLCACSLWAQDSSLIYKPFLSLEASPRLEEVLPGPPSLTDSRFSDDWVQFRRGLATRDSLRGQLAVADANINADYFMERFSTAMGHPVSRANSPWLYLLLSRAHATEWNTSASAKKFFHRIRPYQQFRESSSVPQQENPKDYTSYPSGHTHASWLVGMILTAVDPDHATEIMKVAYEMGQSRVIVGFHYQSDVEAGRVAASVTFARLCAEPEFLSTLEEARKEFAQKRMTRDFVKGADVGSLSQQVDRGVKFHDRKGEERECLSLLKDYQLSAIRLRVWVNPKEGYCGKEDVLRQALHAKELGMDVMIDFHYSDWWADPAKQPIPKAWLKHDFEQMKQDLRAHTIEVLQLLKEHGVTPRWVQIGNETTNGMLWSVKTDPKTGWELKDAEGRTTITQSMAHIEREPEHYAGFIRTGYEAAKEVFPETQVIVHLDNGFDPDLYEYNLGIVLKYGGKFDMIGMSLYPYWAMQGHPERNADQVITDCMANIRRLAVSTGKDVMIVETGMEVDVEHPEVMEEGRRQLARIVQEARTQTDGHCRGVFYWEPQTLPGGYRLGAFDQHGAPTAIMDGFVE